MRGRPDAAGRGNAHGLLVRPEFYFVRGEEDRIVIRWREPLTTDKAVVVVVVPHAGTFSRDRGASGNTEKKGRVQKPRPETDELSATSRIAHCEALMPSHGVSMLRS